MPQGHTPQGLTALVDHPSTALTSGPLGRTVATATNERPVMFRASVIEVHRAGYVTVFHPLHMFGAAPVAAPPLAPSRLHPNWLGELVDPADVAHPGEW